MVISNKKILFVFLFSLGVSYSWSWAASRSSTRALARFDHSGGGHLGEDVKVGAAMLGSAHIEEAKEVKEAKEEEKDGKSSDRPSARTLRALRRSVVSAVPAMSTPPADTRVKNRLETYGEREYGASGGEKRQKIEEKESCTICQHESTEKDPYVNLFSCNHKVMHGQCAQEFLATEDPKCPLCRNQKTAFSAELETAIKEHDTKNVSRLLSTGESKEMATVDSPKKADIKLACKMAPHLLHLSVMLGCPDITMILLDVGFDPAKRIYLKEAFAEEKFVDEDFKDITDLKFDLSAFDLMAFFGLHALVKKCCDKDKKIVLSSNENEATPLHFLGMGSQRSIKNFCKIITGKKIPAYWGEIKSSEQNIERTLHALLVSGADSAARSKRATVMGWCDYYHNETCENILKTIRSLSTALEAEIKEGNAEKVATLLSAGESKRESKAVASAPRQDIEMVIKYSPELLHLAVMIGDAGVINALLAAGFDPALHINLSAALRDQDVLEPHDSPLMYLDEVSAFDLMVCFGLHTLVKQCYDHDREITRRSNKKNVTPLHYLAMGSKKTLKNLEKVLSVLNISFKWGDGTSSHQNIEQTMAILLAAGADPTLQDKQGDNFLHWCGIFNNAKALNCLLSDEKKSVDKEILNKKGQTALLLAARSKSLKVFERLVRAGSNLFARSIFGKSIFHHAVQNQELMEIILSDDFLRYLKIGDICIIDRFISEVFNERDNNKKTPLDQAVENIFPNIVGLICTAYVNYLNKYVGVDLTGPVGTLELYITDISPSKFLDLVYEIQEVLTVAQKRAEKVYTNLKSNKDKLNKICHLITVTLSVDMERFRRLADKVIKKECDAAIVAETVERIVARDPKPSKGCLQRSREGCVVM